MARKLNPDAIRAPVHLSIGSLRLISNQQWGNGHAIEVLSAALAAKQPGSAHRVQALESAIQQALGYMLGTNIRPDPEETRLVGCVPKPGEPCLFHDNRMDFKPKEKTNV